MGGISGLHFEGGAWVGGFIKCGQGTRFSKYVAAKVLCQWNREWTGVAQRLRNSEDVLGVSRE